MSPDGELLAAAGNGGAIWLWEAGSGELLRTLTGHRGPVNGVGFSPDGRWLASAGGDGSVRVWEAGSGELLRELTGHQGTVNGVGFSPDGRWLASAGEDGSVRVWAANGDGCLATLVALAEGWAAVTPDGRYKLEGTVTGAFWYTIGMCRFEPGELDPYLPLLRRLPHDAELLPLDG